MHRETEPIKPPPTRIRRAIELGLATICGSVALGVILWAFLTGEWVFVLFAIVPAWVAKTLFSGDYNDGPSDFNHPQISSLEDDFADDHMFSNLTSNIWNGDKFNPSPPP